MEIRDLLAKYHGEQILRPYERQFYSILKPSLDSQGSAVKEYLYRNGKLNKGSDFFSAMSDEDFETLLKRLQAIASNKTDQSGRIQEDRVLRRAFKRSISKLEKMGAHLI